MQYKLGFTLIECLVALLIIAIVLSASTRSIALLINNVRGSYTRQAANWVAGNTYSQYKINAIYPDLGNSRQDITEAGIDFTVNTQISNTPNPYFRRIEITVSQKNNPSTVIYRTINFISQY